MNIQNGQILTIALGEAHDTVAMECNVHYNVISSAGMGLPQPNNPVDTTGTTPVAMLSDPTAGSCFQVEYMSVCNTDTIAHTISIYLDLGGGNKNTCVTSLLQVGATLEWSRAGLWRVNSTSSQESIVITEFIANGTWTKPAGLKRILGLCVGAGGGSGSGRQGPAGENRFGGSGGGGGGMAYRMVSAADLPATVTVTIGAGGTAGAAPAGTGTNGNNGGIGGDTSFGGIIIAKGGFAGNAGTTSSGAAVVGGQASTSTPAYGPFSISGAPSGAGQTTGNGVGGAGLTGVIGAPGGGGACGISNTNVSGTSLNTGGGVYENGILQTGPVSGASPNGVDDVCNFLLFSSTLPTTYGIGTAGAGGTPAFPQGGNGGRCAGAGASAGTLNGSALTPGAIGGDGLCQIAEFF